MVEWLFDYYANGLHGTAPAGRINLFRIVIAIAVLWKVGYELHRGSWHWLNRGTFLRREFDSRFPRLLGWTRLHRPLIVLKLAASLLLLTGIASHAAAAVLGVAMLADELIEPNYHVVYIASCCLGLALCGGLGEVYSVRDQFSGAAQEEQHFAFGLTLIVIVTISMYWGTAYRKIRTPLFTSGTVLRQFTGFQARSANSFPHRETWYPKLYVRHFSGPAGGAAAARWKPLALMTIGLEILLPFGLLWEVTWPLAATLGLAMHLAFTFLFPVRLVPFSLATVGAYLLFSIG
jgi:uncharacterized membrane protein YphA (DoxX/SURF4 family)